MEEKKRNETSPIFEDLLQDSSMNSIQIREKEFTPFNVEQAAHFAAEKKPRKKFGKRANRKKDAAVLQNKENQVSQEPAIPVQPVQESAPQPVLTPQPATESIPTNPEPAKIKKSAQEKEQQMNSFDELDAFIDNDFSMDGLPGSSSSLPSRSEIEETRSFEHLIPALEKVKDKQTIQVQQPAAAASGFQSDPSRTIEEPQKAEEADHEPAVVLEQEDLMIVRDTPVDRREAERQKTSSAAGLLFKNRENVTVSSNGEVSYQDEEEEEPVVEEDFDLNMEQVAEEENLDEELEEDEPDDDELIDPDASIVDNYDYDLYQDKRRYFLSDYRKIEDYLAAQSRQGYHYVRHEGKKYYFHKGEPENYYYQILYLVREPSDAQWNAWKEKGWELISRIPAKNKKEAGWIVLRHLEVPGSFKETIENEEEKYRFFKKYSNSCRSTMFLLFICMMCCAVTAFLQYEFKGYLIGIVFCGLIFVIAFWVFLMYARMLRKSKKQANLLKARIRLAENGHRFDVLEMENDQELENEWDKLNQEGAGRHRKD